MVIAPRAGLGRGGSCDVWLKLLEELIFGVVADNAISFTTVLEEDHRRDRTDAETAGGDGIGVDIQLRDLHLFALLVCDFFEYRSDHPTRATPGRPEIYEDRSVRFNDLRLEVLVADYLWLGHGAPPISTYTPVADRCVPPPALDTGTARATPVPPPE